MRQAAMMPVRVSVFWASMAITSPAMAGVTTVHVTTPDGKPVRNAVVTMKPVGQAAPAPRISGAYHVEQRNTQFNPFISIVPVNADVAFPNFDPFKHHVYSFSPTKQFELKLFAKDQTRSIRFDKAGIVAIGCNIHDSMSAYIFVTDTAWTARTDADGNTYFKDIPSRNVTVAVWHPFLRAPGGTMSRQIAIDVSNRTEGIAIKLRAPPVHNMGGY
jgi:plastocyanin